MIIAGSARLTAAMICDRNDGTMWRKMMRMRDAPASSAAVMKSSSRSARKRPRTTRASSVQPISEMISVMAKYTCCGDQLDGTAAARPIQSGMVGTERRISMIRWMTVSTQPPCKPEMPPSVTPSSRLSATPARPIVSEVCVASTSRENTSRPNWSVPSRKIASCGRPSVRPSRWRSVGISPNSLYG